MCTVGRSIPGEQRTRKQPTVNGKRVSGEWRVASGAVRCGASGEWFGAGRVVRGAG